MTIVMFLFIILVASGLFFIASDVLKLPSLATGKAMLTAMGSRKEKVKGIDAFISSWAVKLAPYVPMDEYKKSRMNNTLCAAGIHKTPEEYTAFAIVKAGLVALGILPCLLVLPLLAPVACAKADSLMLVPISDSSLVTYCASSSSTSAR